MKLYLAAFAGAAILTLAAPSQVSAVPLFSCPGDCNGATVGTELVSLGGSQYRIDVWFNFTGYTGSATNLLHAVGIKDFTGGSLTGTSVAVFGTTAGGFTGWGLTLDELNANGCGAGSPGIRLCAEAAGETAGVRVNTVSKLAIFAFTFTSTGPLASSVHLKFEFIDPLAPLDNQGNAEKVGSLGSFPVNFTSCGPNCPVVDPRFDPPPVPEPATMTLLGLGLLGAGFVRRRK